MVDFDFTHAQLEPGRRLGKAGSGRPSSVYNAYIVAEWLVSLENFAPVITALSRLCVQNLGDGVQDKTFYLAIAILSVRRSHGRISHKWCELGSSNFYRRLPGRLVSETVKLFHKYEESHSERVC